MGGKYRYVFYYKINDDANINKSEGKGINGDTHIQMEFERNLPLSNKEYEIASKKLVDSVANNYNVEKEYITPIIKKEYMENVKNE